MSSPSPIADAVDDVSSTKSNVRELRHISNENNSGGSITEDDALIGDESQAVKESNRTKKKKTKGKKHCNPITANAKLSWLRKCKYIVKMHRIEVAGILSILITLFCKLYGQKKSSWEYVRPARRFMTANSKVDDLYSGDLRRLTSLVLSSDYSLVFYYAPWCSRSIKAKWEVERVAKLFHQQVSFIAVNCWYPPGQCRRKFSLSDYPQIFLYVRSLRSIRYDGQPTALHLTRFLTQILNPLTPIFSEDGLLKFAAMQENTMIGFFNFNSSPQPPGFISYYLAAIKVIARDPAHVVRFGVVPSLAMFRQFHITQNYTIFLLRSLNDTLVYPYNATFTSDLLTDWAFVYRQPEALRLVVPRKRKSLLLSHFISHMPALILFTSINPVMVQNHAMSLLREVALEYYNCDVDYDIPRIVLESTKNRWISLLEHDALLDQCRTYHVIQSQAANLATDQSDSSKHTPTVAWTQQSDMTTHRCCQSTVNSSVLVICDVCFKYLGNVYGDSKFVTSDNDMCSSDMGVVALSTQSLLHSVTSNLISNVSLSHSSSDNIHLQSSVLAAEEASVSSQPICEEQLVSYSNANRLSVCCDLFSITEDGEGMDAKADMLKLMNEYESVGQHSIVQRISAKRRPDMRDISSKHQSYMPDVSSKHLSRYTGGDDHVRTMGEALIARKCESLRLSKLSGHDTSRGGVTNIRDFSVRAGRLANFSGFGCHSNVTLEFIALDVGSESRVFAERLGLNDTDQGPRVAIFDNEAESQYHLDSKYPLTKETIVKFIEEFSHGRLSRMLRQSDGTAVNIDTWEGRGRGDISEQPAADQPPSTSTCIGGTSACVLDINTRTFYSTVIGTTDKDVVVLYESRWCSYCRSLAHLYYSVMYILRDVPQLLFTRIDADRNDLPWQYTVQKYPTIMLFPAYSKSESAEFPDEELPLTVSNLLWFVLRYSSRQTRLWAGLSLCNRKCILNNRHSITARGRHLLRAITDTRHRFYRVASRLNAIKSLPNAEVSSDPELLAYRDILTEYVTKLHQTTRDLEARLDLIVTLSKLLELKVTDGSNYLTETDISYIRLKLNKYENELREIIKIDNVSVRPEYLEVHEKDEL